MKKIPGIITGIVFLSAIATNTPGQNISFAGTAPSVSLSVVASKKLDFNLLATSKIRIGNYNVKGEYFQQQLLEIYSQVLADYKLGRHWQIGAGYGFQRNNPFDNNWRNENRLVQQVLFIIPFNKNKLLQRCRLEERWLSYPASANQFGTRARYQLGYVKQLEGNMFYWQINDEVFAIPSGSRNAFIAENWIYAGIGFTIKQLGHFETGIGFDSNIRNKSKEWSSLLLLQLAWSFVIPSSNAEAMHPVMHARNF